MLFVSYIFIDYQQSKGYLVNNASLKAIRKSMFWKLISGFLIGCIFCTLIPAYSLAKDKKTEVMVNGKYFDTYAQDKETAEEYLKIAERTAKRFVALFGVEINRGAIIISSLNPQKIRAGETGEGIGWDLTQNLKHKYRKNGVTWEFPWFDDRTIIGTAGETGMEALGHELAHVLFIALFNGDGGGGMTEGEIIPPKNRKVTPTEADKDKNSNSSEQVERGKSGEAKKSTESSDYETKSVKINKKPPEEITYHTAVDTRCTHNFNGYGSYSPDWIDEGVAVYHEPEAQRKMRRDELIGSLNKYIPFRKLFTMDHMTVERERKKGKGANPNGTDKIKGREDIFNETTIIFYAETCSVLEWLIDIDGVGLVRKLVVKLQEGKSTEESLYELLPQEYPRNLDKLGQAWLEWVKKNK